MGGRNLQQKKRKSKKQKSQSRKQNNNQKNKPQSEEANDLLVEKCETSDMELEVVELYEDFVDFYEGEAHGPSQQGEFCKALKDKELMEYEQTFVALRNIIQEIFQFRKYEVFMMLYPTLAMGYLQMVWSGEWQQARDYVERHKDELDASYRKRIENLKLIRKREDMPGRALELLSGGKKEYFLMASTTFEQFKVIQSRLWTSKQQECFGAHFQIASYADFMIPQERRITDHPLPEPFNWAAAVQDSDSTSESLGRNRLPALSFNMATPVDTEDAVTCATLSEDRCSVAFGTGSGMVHVVAVRKDWREANNMRRENVFQAHQQWVMACAFSPGDRHLLTSSADKTMRLWCTRSGLCKIVYTTGQVPHTASCVAFAPRGCYFATASEDAVVRVWREDAEHPIISLFGHLAKLLVCRFHPNGNYLATGSADATVRIWDYRNHAQMRLFRGHKAPVSALVYSNCGRYLVSGGRDDLVIVWDTSDARMLRCLCQHKALSIASIDISYCNNLLAVWSQEGQLTLWDFQLLMQYSSMENGSSAQSNDINGELLIRTVKAPEDMIWLQSGFFGRDGLVAICTENYKKSPEVLASIVQQIKNLQLETKSEAKIKEIMKSMLDQILSYEIGITAEGRF
ncbi:transcription initiation factor TFIID subunit 5-like [Drosophila madeirensis]|uniref:Transcription initiation factor TFIID subunit 5-like n=1 Tax=Drosophila madeirensis TaxID=30013 RepID=A0AAU9FY02_DROMD